MTRPKLLILGHARHGKDTVAEMLRDDYGFDFMSSSEFVGREVMWGNWGKYNYDSFKEMFADRSNHRAVWHDLIAEYNTPDKTKTAATMLSRGYDMYVGMRAKEEVDACIKAELFDLIVWVDRSGHLPHEDKSSMSIPHLYKADWIIDNNDNLDELKIRVKSFVRNCKL